MSRKSLIICLSVLALLAGAITLGVMLLGHGTGQGDEETVIQNKPQFALLEAVPVDAVMVGCFSTPEKVLPEVHSSCGFASSLCALALSESVQLEQVAVSLHNLGGLYPLYVVDAGMAQGMPSESAKAFLGAAEENGLYSEYMEIPGRSFVLASPLKELVLSSKRHLMASESILKAPGFVYAHRAARGDDCIFISNRLSDHLVSSLFHRNLRRFFSEGKRMSDWVVLAIDELSDSKDRFQGSLASSSKQPDIPSVFEDCGVVSSDVSRMLPSGTVSAMTLPLKKRSKFFESYERYLDSRQVLQRRLILRKKLTDTIKVSPVAFCQRLDVQEVATAAFVAGESIHRVNLLKVGRFDRGLVHDTLDVMKYRFSTYAGSLFGNIFMLKDESHYTCIDGWIISGSEEAVSMYKSGEALHYTLREYMANAELEDMFASPASFMAYISFTADPESLDAVFRDNILPYVVKDCSGADYSGAFLTVGANGTSDAVSVDVFRNEIVRSKAPFKAVDVAVDVPTGPFQVRNARTGKDNYFYQNPKNNYLCLKDENGKGVWAVPFDKRICGAAQSVDYMDNGKFQILYGAGTRLYLIDVLGRFVENYAVDLQKEILLGPQVYEFGGDSKYSMMVLHKDNTIEMYDLKGGRPEGWTSITAPEVITGLPERIDVGGKIFWIVRTSVQTLIYPFEGGQPLTDFKGDQMIIPDSEIIIMEESSVEVESYDGKKRNIKLI